MNLATKIHRSLYGKSDMANAPENRSEAFQRGYNAGRDMHTEKERDELWFDEWTRLGQPDYPLPIWSEWKRGFQAARMQVVIAKAEVMKP